MNVWRRSWQASAMSPTSYFRSRVRWRTSTADQIQAALGLRDDELLADQFPLDAAEDEYPEVMA